MGKHCYRIGDPVEVYRVVFSPGSPLLDKWEPATVVSVGRGRVGVAYASGIRQDVERRNVRPARREAALG